MISPRWLLLLLIFQSFAGQAQKRTANDPNWEFWAGAALLRNTVYGDKYISPRPIIPGISFRNVDVLRWRSSATNSFSPAIGCMFERRLYKGLWVAGGIEFLGRHQKYVFDMDTLAAYPPVSHPPAGLHFSKIVDYWYGLELPVMFEYRIKDWSITAGLTMSKQLRTRGVAEELDGTSLVLYDIPSRTSPLLSTAIPKVAFGYDGIGQERRFRLLLGADFRKSQGSVRRWVDIRFGIGVRLGR